MHFGILTVQYVRVSVRPGDLPGGMTFVPNYVLEMEKAKQSARRSCGFCLHTIEM